MSDVAWPCGCSYTKGEGVDMCGECYDKTFGHDIRQNNQPTKDPQK